MGLPLRPRQGDSPPHLNCAEPSCGAPRLWRQGVIGRALDCGLRLAQRSARRAVSPVWVELRAGGKGGMSAGDCAGGVSRCVEQGW